MYPLKFEKVLKEKVWGGHEFRSMFGPEVSEDLPMGESWEVSAHKNGPSIVANGPLKGTSLPDLVQQQGAKLVGEKIFKKYKGLFPLLIKYLDIHDKLSIQVHPDDSFALAHEGEFGKSECWYILKASPDAKLILGMAEGVDAQTFQSKAKAGEWQGLFRHVPVKTGDFIHIVPGTVHASAIGSVLICEIQQNSDTTYRIYDYDRLEKGSKRQLHLDKAIQVIDFAKVPSVTDTTQRTKETIGLTVLEKLVQDPKYKVDLLQINEGYSDTEPDGFFIYMILEGQGTLKTPEGQTPVKAGETWLFPFGVQAETQGKLKVIRASV